MAQLNRDTVGGLRALWRTGAVVWAFHTVPGPDLNDAPNPVVIFDANVQGQARKGLVQVGKTGWAYILQTLAAHK